MKEDDKIKQEIVLHETAQDYCCACEYDIAGFEQEKKDAFERGKEETLREVTKKIKARLVEVPIPPQDEDWGINLTRTEIFNNGVLEARIAVLATLTAQLKGEKEN